MRKNPLWVPILALMSASTGTEMPNAAAASSTKAPQVSLVQEARPTSTICLAQNPTRSAAFAAAELQEHLRKITGALVPIAYDTADKPADAGKGARILVGESLGTRQLGIKSSAFKTQEHLIRFLPNTVVLMGKDDAIVSNEGAALEPPIIAGKFGKSGQFDGTRRQRIVDAGFDDKAGTFEGWVSLADDVANAPGIIFRLDGANPWSYHIVTQPEQTKSISYRVFVDGKKLWSVTSPPLAAGWHFIQATHSEADSKIELFVDGKSQGTDTYSPTTCQGAPLEIGGSPDAATGGIANPFRGLLDDLRVSKRVRAPHVPVQALVVDADTTYLNNFDVPQRTIGNTRTLTPPALFSEKGTLDAVYDFLERFCDVRWYLPGEIGTVAPSVRTLRVGGSDVRRAPNMKYREIASSELYLQTEGARVPERDATLWKLRMRLGGERVAVGHSFEGYFARFQKEHPTWFATPNASQSPQLCYSDPEVIQQVAQDARDYFNGKGTYPGGVAAGPYFSLVPMDTDLWCPGDKARFDKAELDNQMFSNGKASPVIWEFVNAVARDLGKTNPNAYIAALSYWDYAYPPKNLEIEPNVSIQMCLHSRHWWSPVMERNDRKVLDGWVQKTKGKQPLFLWLYYCFPGLSARAGKFNEFPGFFAHTVVEQMKLYKKAGIRGMFIEHSSEMNRSFLLDQLEMYVTWKLADDPSLDGKKLIDEFFPKFYGSAAKPMQALYESIERTFSNPQNYPLSMREKAGQPHQTEEVAWKYLGTAPRMAEWEKLMTEARILAKTPVEKERLALFEAGVWLPMQEGAERYRTTGPVIERLKAQGPPKVAVPAVGDAGGDSAKVDWARAFKVNQWFEVRGAPVAAAVEMRLAHDGKFLYIELIDRRSGKELVNSPDVYSGDEWELFFAAKRAKPYRQFAFNPAGATAALQWPASGEMLPWESGIKVQPAAAGPGWNARLALALDQLVPGGVRRGEPIFINAFRASPGGTALAWSPSFDWNFHDLNRMVELTLE